MTHFPVIIVLPGDTGIDDRQAVAAAVATLMAPYDENTHVAEYERTCSCVGEKAERRATAQARAEVTQAEGESHDDYWARLQQRRLVLATSDPELLLPDPTCGFYTGDRADWWPPKAKAGDRFEDGDGCGGTGKVRSTYNPLSRWDYFRAYQATWLIAAGVDVREDGLFRVAELIGVVERDDRDAWTPRTVVIPDGAFPAARWQANGKIGMFASVSGNDTAARWQPRVLDLLRRYRDHAAVVVDCHI